MNKRKMTSIAMGAALLAAAGIVWSQRFGGGGFGGGGEGGGGGGGGNGLIYINGDPYGHEPDGRLYSWPRRPIDLSDRQGIPEWPVDPQFKGNLFTFCRINYYSNRFSDSWQTDYPSSDLNISFRLPELTTIQTNPNPVWRKLDAPDLANFPFIYMVEVGTLVFQNDEAKDLRKYLMNGGFLMVDDFFGVQAWDHFHEQMKLVFPDREPVELDLSHPIFHIVFDLKEKPQIPAIEQWAMYHTPWERPDAIGAHYWAYFDDKGRMVCIICQNTDLGDGWSRELSVAKLLQNVELKRGVENDPATDTYFHDFCEKLGYPMGVNIITYALTH